MLLYRDRVLQIARSQIGTTENPPGSNSGPRVRKYQAATTLKGTGWPWCDAFVAWCFREAGLPLRDPTASTVQSLQDAIKSHTKIPHPYPGCIVLFDFPGGDEVDHTGIVEKVNRLGIVTIEGNTSPDSNGSQGNGGGVFRRTRRYAECKAFYYVPGTLRPIPAKKPKPAPWRWAFSWGAWLAYQKKKKGRG